VGCSFGSHRFTLHAFFFFQPGDEQDPRAITTAMSLPTNATPVTLLDTWKRPPRWKVWWIMASAGPSDCQNITPLSEVKAAL